MRVANLLGFYERTLPGDYVTEALGPLRLRMHREERAALQRHASMRLRAAWDDMVRRYGFIPEGPVSIELYASPEHFSVRTSGVPEGGVQGVCFGPVVTALSPRQGSVHWARITCHELANVLALQRTRAIRTQQCNVSVRGTQEGGRGAGAGAGRSFGCGVNGRPEVTE